MKHWQYRIPSMHPRRREAAEYHAKTVKRVQPVGTLTPRPANLRAGRVGLTLNSEDCASPDRISSLYYAEPDLLIHTTSPNIPVIIRFNQVNSLTTVHVPLINRQRPSRVYICDCNVLAIKIISTSESQCLPPTKMRS